jgi:hypothetical protein
VGFQVNEIPLNDQEFEQTKDVAKALRWDFDAELAKKRFDDGVARKLQLEFQHRAKAGSTALPLSAESNGTQEWLFLVAQILHVLKTGAILCVDERSLFSTPTTLCSSATWLAARTCVEIRSGSWRRTARGPPTCTL